MKILIVYAHPVETSFVASLHREIVDTLHAGGHQIDDCDLHAEEFHPVLSRQERVDYHDTAINRRHVEAYVQRLLAAEGLVLVYPVWNFGFPAILKGFLDRIFLPGVSFRMQGSNYLPALGHVRKLAAVCTYGAHRWRAILTGDPPRRCVKRMMRSLIDPRGSCTYLGHYDMNRTTAERRAAFLKRVRRHFALW